MSVSSLNTCSPSTFGGLSFFGAKVLSIDANLVTNFSASVPAVSRVVQPAVELRNATFCNVTVTYTHPGQGDNINVETWLPVGTWNGRLQAVGGAGWAAGRLSFAYEPMKGALADGYATVTTDAGLGAAQEPSPWALVSQGNVNLYNLQNFGSVSLNDQATIAKSVIRSFYGQDPTFSYWTGCSQGGRQGLALAQRYPTAYDGILAGAPVVYATEVVGSMFWPQQVMSMLGQHPFGCEIRAMTTAAISACDGLDGVVDGVIANPEACLGTFDPFILVGQQTDCPEANKSVQISTTAAIVTNATWRGRITADGRPAWHGFNPDTDIGIFSSDPRMLSGVAATNCTSGTCIGVVNLLVTGWLTQFIAKGARLDFGNITHVQADGLIHAGRQQYGSIFDADDPDLTEFRAAGGKLVTYHGMVDGVVPPGGSRQYFHQVAARLPEIDGFYRHYEIPGMAHCFGGPSGPPTSLFDQLRAWVENGTALGSLHVPLTVLDGSVQNRTICPYPRRSQYRKTCGNPAEAGCWFCDETSTPIPPAL